MRSKFTLALFMVVVGCLLPGASIARALPDGRAYEMVSPVDKNGADAKVAWGASPDGERLGYMTLGNALGDPNAVGLVNPYRAIRRADGWESRAMLAPAGYPNVGLLGSVGPADFSTDLSTAISLSRSVESEPNRINVFATDLNGNVTWVTEPAPGVPIGDLITDRQEKAYAGLSGDGSRIFFESTQPFSNQPGLNGSTQVWEWFDGQVSLVSLLPDGTVPPGGAWVGDQTNGGDGEGSRFVGRLPQPDAVSEDGSKVFFNADGGIDGNLYVRENGSTTRAIGPPGVKKFLGASADGNVVVFGSGSQLTDDATTGGGLYAFDLRTEVLRFLSAGALDSSGAQFRGYSLISRDGSRVYFVAGGVLVPGEGVPGGHNLYVADTSGLDYIATLGEFDGQAWSPPAGAVGGRTTAATPDGRYFVFQSYEQLTDFETHGHRQIYLYDDVADTLGCVSCGEAGHVVAGDASVRSNPANKDKLLEIAQYGQPRTITADGSRVFFQSTDALVSQDVNGVADVYEYRRDSGSVELISAGTGSKASEILDISADGRDVFFTTRDSLLGRDIDGGTSDIYDAREGGGFPEPAPTLPCEGDACQAQTFGPPAPEMPGTSNLSGAGNARKSSRSGIRRIRKISRPDRSRLAKGGKGRLRLDVDRSGKIVVDGTATVGGKSRRVVSSSAEAEKAGAMTIPFALSKSGRSALRHQGSLTVALKVRFNDARPKVVTFTLISVTTKGGRS